MTNRINSSTMGSFPFFLSSPFINNETADQAGKDEEKRKKDHETCNKYIKKGLTRDVTVQFLIKKLIDLGCAPPEGFIKCIDCGDKQAGGGFGVVEETVLPISSNLDDNIKSHEEYKHEAKNRRQKQCSNTQTLKDLQEQLKAQNEGRASLRLLPEIFLCQQNLVNDDHASQSMVHELIHAIDLCRTKMDPINNCIHMACTEIRAENLSGECGAVREIINGRVTNFKGHGAECVKRRAILSVKANPNCSEKAHEYVNAAFERCFRDTFPFDRHPNLR
jgi:inner membrane protease ATP23